MTIRDGDTDRTFDSPRARSRRRMRSTSPCAAWAVCAEAGAGKVMDAAPAGTRLGGDNVPSPRTCANEASLSDLPTERKILRLIGEGKSSQAIADLLSTTAPWSHRSTSAQARAARKPPAVEIRFALQTSPTCNRVRPFRWLRVSPAADAAIRAEPHTKWWFHMGNRVVASIQFCPIGPTMRP
jgi:hypothetical protein